MAEASRKPKHWRPKSEMKDVGGEKGKLHREMGIPEGEKIPKKRLHAAANSSNPEEARDAKRAETMAGWRKPGRRLRDVYKKKGS